MKIKEISKEVRPRERFFQFGPEALSESELLSIILRTGTKGENVLDLSNKLISKFGIMGIFDCSIEELMKIKGIGRSKAIELLAAFEIVKRINMLENKKEKISCAQDVFEIFKDKLKNEKKENFYGIFLNTQNKIIKYERITLGILDASLVHPREVFNLAIRSCASKVILVHNHPSGNSNPSEEDIFVTEKLIEAGEIVGIEIIDHVVIGRDSYWSYNENN